MSNLYSDFLGLIPSYPLLVGTVTNVEDETHIIELLGGGALTCQSQKVYEVGQQVYVKDLSITSEAPNNTTVQFRV